VGPWGRWKKQKKQMSTKRKLEQKEGPTKRNKVFLEKAESLPRNPGIPLDLAWVAEAQVNRAALTRRAASHAKRRTVKKATQLGWLLRLINVIDLTALAGDDTDTNVERLCFKARQPLRQDFIEKLDMKDMNLTTGAVCVYPNRVAHAAKVLAGTGIPIASVAAGFPAGQTPIPQRLEEIRMAVEAGASEIDIVISREHVINADWKALYDEVKMFVQACGDRARLKAIIAVGELPTLRDVYKTSLICMMAGSDFIKTSTGKEPTNATLVNSLLMMRAVRDFHERTGIKVGFKPAGGISNAKVMKC
jgi:deoxyribose-phosphate aldolase